jgi:hypothetical protein
MAGVARSPRAITEIHAEVRQSRTAPVEMQPAMSTTFATHSAELGTELAHRTGSGLDVTLYWNQATDRVIVVVHDHQADHRFGLTVDRARASYAFNHPFAYAASQDSPPNAATAQHGITSDRATVTARVNFSAAAEPTNRHGQ